MSRDLGFTADETALLTTLRRDLHRHPELSWHETRTQETLERVLRESTRALTTTLPNSVIWLFGIFSASSRSRSAGGFHSTDAAFTS